MKSLVDSEEWVSVKGYEGLYEVSNKGRVRSLDRTEVIAGRHPEPFIRKRKGTILSPRQGPYLNINLCKDGKKRNVLIHRLVAVHFCPNPDNKPEVNHLDEDKHNNCSSNLVWCSSSENSKHSSYKTTGSKCGTSKLNEDKVILISYLLRNTDLTLQQIADQFNVSNHAIFRIKAGYNWSWLTGFGKEGSRHV